MKFCKFWNFKNVSYNMQDACGFSHDVGDWLDSYKPTSGKKGLKTAHVLQFLDGRILRALFLVVG